MNIVTNVADDVVVLMGHETGLTRFGGTFNKYIDESPASVPSIDYKAGESLSDWTYTPGGGFVAV